MTERKTYIWQNPIGSENWVMVETPLKGGGTHLGGVAKIEKRGVKWFPDVHPRLKALGISKEDILEDLRVLFENTRLLL